MVERKETMNEEKSKNKEILKKLPWKNDFINKGL